MSRFKFVLATCIMEKSLIIITFAILWWHCLDWNFTLGTSQYTTRCRSSMINLTWVAPTFRRWRLAFVNFFKSRHFSCNNFCLSNCWIFASTNAVVVLLGGKSVDTSSFKLLGRLSNNTINTEHKKQQKTIWRKQNADRPTSANLDSMWYFIVCCCANAVELPSGTSAGQQQLDSRNVRLANDETAARSQRSERKVRRTSIPEAMKPMNS